MPLVRGEEEAFELVQLGLLAEEPGNRFMPNLVFLRGLKFSPYVVFEVAAMFLIH